MAKSDPTKHYHRMDIFFSVLSWAIMIIPMAVFIVMGFITGPVVSKVALGLTTIAAIIMLAIAALQKTKLRSPFWLVVIGLAFCLNEVYTMLIIMGVATIMDELIFSPLSKYYHSRYVINDQIDKRL